MNIHQPTADRVESILSGVGLTLDEVIKTQIENSEVLRMGLIEQIKSDPNGFCIRFMADLVGHPGLRMLVGMD